ncbi:MAG: hypothetical protein U0802_03985 [Candidatus Binatia bacterium]
MPTPARIGRAVAGEGEVALQAFAEILDLGDQVVAAVVAGGEAAQVLRQVDADHRDALAGVGAGDAVEGRRPAVAVGEHEHHAGGAAVGRRVGLHAAEAALVARRDRSAAVAAGEQQAGREQGGHPAAEAPG